MKKEYLILFCLLVILLTVVTFYDREKEWKYVSITDSDNYITLNIKEHTFVMSMYGVSTHGTYHETDTGYTLFPDLPIPIGVDLKKIDKEHIADKLTGKFVFVHERGSILQQLGF